MHGELCDGLMGSRWDLLSLFAFLLRGFEVPAQQLVPLGRGFREHVEEFGVARGLPECRGEPAGRAGFAFLVLQMGQFANQVEDDLSIGGKECRPRGTPRSLATGRRHPCSSGRRTPKKESGRSRRLLPWTPVRI